MVNINNFCNRHKFFILDQIIRIVAFCLIILIFTSETLRSGKKFSEYLFSGIVLLVLILLFQKLLKSYKVLWRYAGSREYLVFIAGEFCGLGAFLLVDYIFNGLRVHQVILTLTCFVALLLMIIARFSFKTLKSYFKNDNYEKTHIAIIGAGTAGVSLLLEAKKKSSKYIVDCMFDDNRQIIGRTICGVKVEGPISAIVKKLKTNPVHEIIIAIPSLNEKRKKEIIDYCLMTDCAVKTLPDVWEIMENKSPLSSQIKSINIEDLLGRKAIEFDKNEVKDYICGKTVMVTGGGGSIGSELCRQIASIGPKTLIVVDIYENSAYELQQQLLKQYDSKLDLKIEIASVREEKTIDKLFEHYRPNVVFHAAAHKHVPLMESCPAEAIKNNIFGTYNVVKSADKWECEKFVLISTDKAVNPTNIMGASKRFCEMILQSMRKTSRTEFVAVRFGNVLGSNGSVIPLFKNQIENNWPVTITDKRIVRYFMTIQEATQLILLAGNMSDYGDVFVLDMGEPVRIIDLAEKMIKLYGKKPYEDVPIIEIGLRPGEKLYEELLIVGENHTATKHQKIYIEKQQDIPYYNIQNKLHIIDKALSGSNNEQLKEMMKKMVDTYKDNEEVNKAAIKMFAYKNDCDLAKSV